MSLLAHEWRDWEPTAHVAMLQSLTADLTQAHKGLLHLGSAPAEGGHPPPLAVIGGDWLWLPMCPVGGRHMYMLN